MRYLCLINQDSYDVMKKSLLILLSAIAICSCSEQKEQKAKAPVRVETETVSSGMTSDSHTYVGTVEERTATAVSFTGMGLVKRMLVSEGQSVGRGQLIAEIDDTQARNLLSGAEAQMAQANDALQRYKMLYDAGSLPEVQWVEIKSKVAQAQSQLQVARKNLSDCRLTAPVSGIIGKKMVGAGETALPSQAVVTILDISTVKVKVSIPEGEISSIRANTPSLIKVEAIDGTYHGGTIEKGVSADVMTHTYDIRINVANSDRRLLPGMVATVSFSGGVNTASESQTSVPVTSVQKNADGSLFVWTVDKDKHAHRCNVTIGSTHGNRVSITGGLSDGQRIITQGYQKLSEGTRVIY